MVDRPEQIFQFLPLSYSSPVEGEYVSFWWEAYRKNFEEQNYHISFLAFHMLYMTSVYFLLYKISKMYRLEYEHSLFHMGNEDEVYYSTINSAFSFSRMNEKGVFRFLKVAGADYTLIGDVSRFIEERNNAAHAKGAIFFKNDPDGLERKAVDYVKALEKIQNLSIKNFVRLTDLWKVSKLDEAALRIYLEGEIIANNLNPSEIREIILKEKSKRPLVASILKDLVPDHLLDDLFAIVN